jgi:hypothetical protein
VSTGSGFCLGDPATAIIAEGAAWRAEREIRRHVVSDEPKTLYERVMTRIYCS